ncbi:uncharacterized protein TNCV_1488881 [Trichonephila clavipes]|nr:uncharacterized protein TNCV_1488881 [Trichonephila clavipes]
MRGTQPESKPPWNTAGTRLFHYANTCGLVISAPTDFTRIPQQQNHQPSVIDLGVFLRNQQHRRKNRLRKLWQQNRYPPLKTELNRLQRDIKKDLLNIKQREWDDALVECSHTNDSLHKLIARAKKKPVIYPPLLGFQGLVYGTREKADLFVDTLEDSFQENRTPYDDDHIDKVDRTVRRFLRNNIPIYPPLTSPQEICEIIKKLKIKKPLDKIK